MLNDYLIVFFEWLIRTLKTRVFWLGVICILLFSLLVGQLYQLQIRDGAQYYENYISKTKREIHSTAVRGNIYDRNGVMLAGNKLTYNLTIKDTGEYTTKNGEYNEMLLRLIHLLKRFNVSIASECPVVINEHGEFEMSGSESKIRQFIRDIYGQDEIDDKAKQGIDVYSYDTQTIMESLLKIYNFDERYWPGAADISKEEALDICNIRYAMSATSYTKYRSTTIATDISDELATAVLEAQADMVGVEVEEATVRVYPDSEYFSHIIGYTGKPSAEELKTYQEIDSSYTASDLVGKSGLEKVYEEYLAGTKGTDTVYLNNVGLILETISSVEPVNGNDIWLSLDHDLTVASYHLIEQRLAAIIVSKLTEDDFTSDASMLADDFYIPITDVYFQMINNNVLDFKHFASEDATENERAIQDIFDNYQSMVLTQLKNELSISDAAVMRQQATEEMQEYYDFILSLLTSRDRNILQRSKIDVEDEIYTAWAEGSISLQEYLKYAVSEGWIDSSKLDVAEKYSSAEDVYDKLLEKVMVLLLQDDGFTKLIYQYMIEGEYLTGNRICLALVDQGILTESESVYEQLLSGTASQAFEYMKEKIENIEITPAQIALDPCSGAAVVVDEDTGDLLALVSYPGYDLNKFSGTVDSAYWKQISEDLSSPLYNRATQVRTAPGSTFKMVTATAGLEEGVINKDELITCLGTYDKLDHPMCWIAREQGGTHGALNTQGGLEWSCNFYFYEVGYRLSLNEDGEYDPAIGLEKLGRYASMYGFGEKTGLEIEENVSNISTEYPVASAIGQGTHNFTAVSLARYATAVATKGTLYQFQLLDKVYDTNGNLVLDEAPTVERVLEFSDSTWDVLHKGMYDVTHTGSASAIFTDCEVEIAGKSGSAQENKLRGNHGMFVSFAPADDPEIVVAVSIPNGYTAGNAGLVSKEIYRYYFGYTTLEDILENNYSSNSGSTTISD